MKFNLGKTMVGLFVIFLVTGAGLAETKYVIGVDGLSCPFCAYGLEKKLKKVENVNSVSIDMDRGQAVVSPKAGTTIKEEALRKAVKEAGFSVSSLEKVESGAKSQKARLRPAGDHS
ncbi:heavy-metal-associated domain-containing protein [Acidobacteria bacterium AH-259-D05]|nr:heavy-metal-associated domain-containing protein [Acidobacteria bacterium AH-259-D05]